MIRKRKQGENENRSQPLKLDSIVLSKRPFLEEVPLHIMKERAKADEHEAHIARSKDEFKKQMDDVIKSQKEAQEEIIRAREQANITAWKKMEYKQTEFGAMLAAAGVKERGDNRARLEEYMITENEAEIKSTDKQRGKKAEATKEERIQFESRARAKATAWAAKNMPKGEVTDDVAE